MFIFTPQFICLISYLKYIHIILKPGHKVSAFWYPPAGLKHTLTQKTHPFDLDLVYQTTMSLHCMQWVGEGDHRLFLLLIRKRRRLHNNMELLRVPYGTEIWFILSPGWEESDIIFLKICWPYVNCRASMICFYRF